MTTKPFKPTTVKSTAWIISLNEATLSDFLAWINAQGYAICQWQPSGTGEYLTDVTEQAITALPILYLNHLEKGPR
jgi:hypothetical protein